MSLCRRPGRPDAMTTRRLAGLVLGLGLLLPLAACGAGARTDGPAASPSVAGGSGAPVTVTVLAAASLTESFDQIAADYEATHPNVTIRLSYGGSSALAQQIVQGAPVDVFAAASTTTMDTAVASGRMGTPTTFATNKLEIAVPPANPGGVTDLTDLASSSVTVALCEESVPCGAAATKVLSGAGLVVQPVTRETDVKAVLTKVSLGEVDAGLVYVTDVVAAGSSVGGISIPDDRNAITSYPISIVTDGPAPAAAQDFVDHITSAEGEQVLASHGFGRP